MKMNIVRVQGVIVILYLVGGLMVDGATIRSEDESPTMKITSELSRTKRQTTWKCKKTSCINGKCTPLTYEGPNPPDWCKNSGSGGSSGGWPWGKNSGSGGSSGGWPWGKNSGSGGSLGGWPWDDDNDTFGNLGKDGSSGTIDNIDIFEGLDNGGNSGGEKVKDDDMELW